MVSFPVIDTNRVELAQK